MQSLYGSYFGNWAPKNSAKGNNACITRNVTFQTIMKVFIKAEVSEK